MAFDRSFHSPLRAPSHCQVRAFLVGDYASLHCRLKTAAVFGAIDCALHSLRPPQLPSLAAGLLRFRSLRLQTIFNGYVPALRRHPSFVGVLARFTPLLTRNLRLLFRLVNAGALLSELQSPLRHTVSHVPPTHRGSCRLHSKLSAFAPTPGPDVRCADALTPLRQTANRFTHSEFAYGLGQGQVGRLSNRKRIFETACRSTALHDTCRLPQS